MTPADKRDKLRKAPRPSGEGAAPAPTVTGSVPPGPESVAKPARLRSRAGQLTGAGLLTAWAISIAFHILLFTAMFMVPWLSRIVDDEDDFPIPNAELLGELQETSFDTSEFPDFTDKVNISSPDELKIEPDKFQQLADLSDISRPDLTVIGIGAGGGEDFSKFGLKAGGDSAPSFFGQRAQGARKVVFVVDRSGSMTDTFDFVREELKRSVGAMRRSQKFHAIFFSSGSPLENPPRRLVSAIKAQKAEFFDFLDGISTAGSTEPEPAMRRAFEVKPDLIYFLTDGEFNAALIGKLDKMNKDRRVRIFTIAYFNQEGAELLKRIAREHRGEFKFVTENDIP